MSLDHRVQLFDTFESRVECVSAFLNKGFAANDVMLVVATGRHWPAIEQRLVTDGQPVPAALADWRLNVFDADHLLTSLMRQGRPNPAAFDDIIGGLVTGLAAMGRRVRIYGEMVDLLARESDLAGARMLEGLWNGLGARVPFILLCGYESPHFGDARSAADLRAICDQHTSVHVAPPDELGVFLIAQHVSAPLQS
jgi:hypothetical protein